MKPCYLYKITNLVNGKLYIGISERPAERKAQHFDRSAGPKKSLVRKAIDKYGKENFTFELLCMGDRDYIAELETKAIFHYNSILPNGYNIRFQGEGPDSSGYKISVVLETDRYWYVRGFWFPNTRTVLTKLNIPKKGFYILVAQGKLGDEDNFNKNKVRDYPQYVGGFWWPHLHIAQVKLGVSIKRLGVRIKHGYIEQKDNRVENSRINLSNYHATKLKSERAIPISIYDVEYESLTEAVKLTGITIGTLRNNLKNKTEGFKYLTF